MSCAALAIAILAQAHRPDLCLPGSGGRRPAGSLGGPRCPSAKSKPKRWWAVCGGARRISRRSRGEDYGLRALQEHVGGPGPARPADVYKATGHRCHPRSPAPRPSAAALGSPLSAPRHSAPLMRRATAVGSPDMVAPEALGERKKTLSSSLLFFSLLFFFSSPSLRGSAGHVRPGPWASGGGGRSNKRTPV